MDDFTRRFKIPLDKDAEIHQILTTVYQALEEKGYNPINQIVGYILSEDPSVTYQYYFDHIKPAPAVSADKKKGWVCKICGYVYEGETLPSDFVCPLCKHSAADFEPVG